MDKFPLLLEDNPAGELICLPEGDCVRFDLRCRLPEKGLWCAWAIGDRGELRLGVLERSGNQASLRRRFSSRMTAPIGRLCRGELRPADAAKKPPLWTQIPAPETLFQAPWLRQRLRGVQNARYRRTAERLYLALPYDPKQVFPLTTLFCFAQISHFDGGQWAVFIFDSEESPVFS